MNKKKWIIGLLVPVVILAAAFGLWQLGSSAMNALIGRPPEPTVPPRLVTRIDVAVFPVNPDAARCYTTQSDLTRMLQLLRNMSTADPAPDAPDTGSAVFFHSITLTYVDGSSAICYLLEDQYLLWEGSDCYYAEPTLVEALHAFLKLPPGTSDSTEPPASIPETTAPASESTAPSA